MNQGIIIVQMSPDEFKGEIRQLVKEAWENSPRPDVVLGRLVNRDFLKTNYSWSKHKVNSLLRSGTLTRELTENGKTDYFLLSQCEAIYAAGKKR